MSELNPVRVFMLGAGCSAKCEYPLQIAPKQQWQDFLGEIPTDCGRIRRSVSDTITLMQTLPAIETLDQLAMHLEQECAARKRTEQDTDHQILNAKIATSALFVAREMKVRGRSLPGYTHLLGTLLGGKPWEKAVNGSDAHVLSFNYDRVLEIAFRDHFKSFDPQQWGIHSECALNSGFNNCVNGGYDRVGPVPGRFCFLKLHGSVGWWVREFKGNRGRDGLRRYWPAMPSAKDDLQGIEQRLKDNEGRHQPWEPLIAFPHEKQRAVRRETDLLADPYLAKSNERAASVLANATDVRIIGYSFAPIDSRHVVSNLLNKIPADSRIVVQNMDVTAVRSRLEAYPSMRDRLARGYLVFDSTPF